ncbi:hypothetical protein MASSI9I_50872 [Massilia sp. 9I]|nr:hypothetical protein MASSI9I_50872 [Massilia sp. 9I]
MGAYRAPAEALDEAGESRVRGADAFPTPAFYRIPRRKARFWGSAGAKNPGFAQWMSK